MPVLMETSCVVFSDPDPRVTASVVSSEHAPPNPLPADLGEHLAVITADRRIAAYDVPLVDAGRAPGGHVRLSRNGIGICEAQISSVV
jgi:hypothetical protein